MEIKKLKLSNTSIVKINALKGQYADSLTPVVVLTKIQDVKIVSEPVRENQPTIC